MKPHPTIAEAKTGDVVRVRWRDSSRVDLGWSPVRAYRESIDEMRETLEETTGYFLFATDAYAFVILSVLPKGDEPEEWAATDGMAIPHEAIRAFDVLAARADLGLASAPVP